MSYSQEIIKFGDWLRKETKVKNVSFQIDSAHAGLYAFIFMTESVKDELSKRARLISFICRVSSPIDQWSSCLDVVQSIENNLQVEREHNIIVGEISNPDSIDGGSGRFRLDIPITIRVLTGKTN